VAISSTREMNSVRATWSGSQVFYQIGPAMVSRHRRSSAWRARHVSLSRLSRYDRIEIGTPGDRNGV